MSNEFGTDAKWFIETICNSIGWKAVDTDIMNRIYASGHSVNQNKPIIDSFGSYIPFDSDSGDLVEKKSLILDLDYIPTPIEGKVVIQYDIIEQYCRESYPHCNTSMGLTFESEEIYFKALLKIALWHSLAYWALHWMIDVTEKKWEGEYWVNKPIYIPHHDLGSRSNANIRFSNRSREERNLEEIKGLIANLITLFVIDKHSESDNLKPLFFDLVNDKKNSNKEFKSILAGERFGWQSTFKAIESVKTGNKKKIKVWFFCSLEIWQLILKDNSSIGNRSIEELVIGKESELEKIFEKYEDELTSFTVINY